jgi:hypothetical protein
LPYRHYRRIWNNGGCRREKKEALDSDKISHAEFDMAYRVLNELTEKKILTVAFMETLCYRILAAIG